MLAAIDCRKRIALANKEVLVMAGELVMGAVYAPALDDYYAAERGQGARKNGRPIRVSDETQLASSMISTQSSSEPENTIARVKAQFSETHQAAKWLGAAVA